MSRRNSRIPTTNTKPNTKKRRKQREKDPVTLVLQHGMAQEMRWSERDEDGKREQRMVSAPKGVVLGPVQAYVLAQYIQKLNYLLQIATQEEPEDGHTDQEVEEIVTGMEGQATDLSKLGQEG